jgi:hypothetical protein
VTPFNVIHEFATEPEAFWKLFFHEPYNEDLYDQIGVKERKFLDRSEDAHTVKWTLRILPKRDLPAVIKKIVGGDLGYTEISTMYKAKSKIDVRIEPTLLTERTQIRAEYTLDPIGPGRVRRAFTGTIHVDLPLVGRKVEATVLEDLRKSYEVAARVTSAWLLRGGV